MPTAVLNPSDSALRAPAAWLQALATDFAQRDVSLADGSRLSVRECGPAQGTTVLLLHGIGSGAASWLPCARLIGQRLRTIAWDAPGYGTSTPLDSDRPDASAYAAKVTALLDALALPRVLLVGHSLGCIVAAAVAKTAPERVAHLRLFSAAAGYGGAGRNADANRVRSERLSALQTLGIAGIAAERGARLVSEHANDDARQWVRWNMAQLQDRGYRQAIELLCGEDIHRFAPLAVQVPVAVHVGQQDTVTLPAQVAAVARSFGVSATEIEQAGHACYVEQPQTVANLILEGMPALSAAH